MWPEAVDYIAASPIVLTLLVARDKNRCLKQTCSSYTLGDTMRDFMAVTKALADENRVRLLLALRKRELCLCQLIELVQLAPSTVSKHMSILKEAGLVDCRKEGRWMYYRLPGSDAAAVVRKADQ